jgi:hypothetical protein
VQEVGENCIMRSCIICSSLDFIWMIKSRRVRWAGHVACMGERRNVYKILLGKPVGKSHSEELGVDGKIILLCCCCTYSFSRRTLLLPQLVFRFINEVNLGLGPSVTHNTKYKPGRVITRFMLSIYRQAY